MLLKKKNLRNISPTLPSGSFRGAEIKNENLFRFAPLATCDWTKMSSSTLKMFWRVFFRADAASPGGQWVFSPLPLRLYYCCCFPVVGYSIF